MRQSSITLILIVLHVINVFPQKPAVSINAGFSFSKWESVGSASQFDNKFKVGLLTGVNADVPVAPRFTVQSELHYTMFGSVYTSGDQHSRYRTNYLLLPVMARYNMDNGFSLFCGPQAGLLVRAKSFLDQERYDIRDEMKRTDFFLVFATEYATRSGIRFGFRYQHGLRNVSGSEAMSLKNRGFSMSMTYELNGGLWELMKAIFK